MIEFLRSLLSFFESVVVRLDSAQIMTVGAVSVSLFDLLLAFIVLSMVCSVFWKGVRG